MSRTRIVELKGSQLRSTLDALEARMKRAAPGSAARAAMEDKHVALWLEKKRRLQANGNLNPIRKPKGRNSPLRRR